MRNMAKRLTDEEKALLARLLDEEDDTDGEEPDEDTEPDTEPDGEPDGEPDEFTYRGKRYVYTPDDVAEAREQLDDEPENKPAPRKRTVKKDPTPPTEEIPAQRKRRFLT